MKNLTYAKFQKYSNLNILIDLFHFWKLSLLIAATGRPLANSNLNPRNRAIWLDQREESQAATHCPWNTRGSSPVPLTRRARWYPSLTRCPCHSFLPHQHIYPNVFKPSYTDVCYNSVLPILH